jgi:alkanesulfonate monooxygenase SsuD/methylene tetrahydromethanopterin reductase-like flavin-dependent oxidoreductase (luciferase family)
MGETSDRQRVEPLGGTPKEIADALLAYADEGIGHVQLVLDPITIESIEALAPVLDELDRQRETHVAAPAE